MFLKNRSIAILLLLLVLANMATIAMYWLGRKKAPPAFLQDKTAQPPSEFLIGELSLDSGQRAAYLNLVKAHQAKTKELREKTKVAKDRFFDLIKQPVLNDTLAKNEVAQISWLVEQQDMTTLQHFRQVRALCNAPQQQKFDSIIHQMLGIMANQRPNVPPKNEDGDEMKPHRNERRPPPDGQRPPPPDGERPPPPDRQGPPPDGKRPPPPDA